MDPIQFREALSCFATGVTVITAVGPDGRPIGITADSFNSVSLDPPLILFSLSRRAYSLNAFLSSGTFAVNILRDRQQELSARFARTLSDKWSGVAYDLWDTGCPILHDALAKLECKTRNAYDGGDHVIFVGEVLRFEYDPNGRPLVFYRGRYRGVAPVD